MSVLENSDALPTRMSVCARLCGRHFLFVRVSVSSPRVAHQTSSAFAVVPWGGDEFDREIIGMRLSQFTTHMHLAEGWRRRWRSAVVVVVAGRTAVIVIDEHFLPAMRTSTMRTDHHTHPTPGYASHVTSPTLGCLSGRVTGMMMWLECSPGPFDTSSCPLLPVPNWSHHICRLTDGRRTCARPQMKYEFRRFGLCGGNLYRFNFS